VQKKKKKSVFFNFLPNEPFFINTTFYVLKVIFKFLNAISNMLLTCILNHSPLVCATLLVEWKAIIQACLCICYLLYTFVKVMNNDKVGRECTSSFSIVASAMVRTSSCTSKWKSCIKIKGKIKEHMIISHLN
jgi:hypothetical protein